MVDCTCELEVHVIALAAVRHKAQLPADALPPADHDWLLQHAAQLEPVQGNAIHGQGGFECHLR